MDIAPYPQHAVTPLSALASAMCRRLDRIMDDWEESMRGTLPPAARRLGAGELRDNLRDILRSVADALASPRGPEGVPSPEAAHRGLERFQQGFSPADLLRSERCLRRCVLGHVASELGRPPEPAELVALVGLLDEAMHAGTLAFIEHQQGELDAAAEAERSFVSFLSHDIGNHLTGTRMWLAVLRNRLAEHAEFADHAAMVDRVSRTIAETIDGMGKLLQHERLCRAAAPPARRVSLAEILDEVAREHAEQNGAGGAHCTVAAPADAQAETDRELLAIVLHNLVGNAAKHAGRGEIRVAAEPMPDGGGWVLSVSDEGPGIPPDRLPGIFKPVHRGDTRGTPGVGLGLAIASKAAAALGAELTVESEVGVGTTFRLRLPDAPSGAQSG